MSIPAKFQMIQWRSSTNAKLPSFQRKNNALAVDHLLDEIKRRIERLIRRFEANPRINALQRMQPFRERYFHFGGLAHGVPIIRAPRRNKARLLRSASKMNCCCFRKYQLFAQIPRRLLYYRA